MDIGKRIASIRRQQKISQETLAQKVGISANTIINLEKNQHCQKFDILQRILEELGYDMVFIQKNHKYIINN